MLYVSTFRSWRSFDRIDAKFSINISLLAELGVAATSRNFRLVMDKLFTDKTLLDFGHDRPKIAHQQKNDGEFPRRRKNQTKLDNLNSHTVKLCWVRPPDY